MTRFRIDGLHGPEAKPRLYSAQMLNSADFLSIARALPEGIQRARKIGFVSARAATAQTAVETHWNGRESADKAEPGDWITTSMTPARALMRDGEGRLNTYVIRAARFPQLYVRDSGETEAGAIFRAIGEVQALWLAGGFEIMAPWGEMQRAAAGFLVLNGEEVYGNNSETFEKTYLRLP